MQVFWFERIWCDRRVDTTSSFLHYLMEPKLDTDLTRMHWIVDQKINMTSFLCSERILTIFSRPYKQKVTLEKIPFMKGSYKHLRHFESMFHVQRRVRGSVLEWQHRAYFLQLKVFARKKIVSTKSTYKYLRYSPRKKIVFMTGSYKYLRYFESFFICSECSRIYSGVAAYSILLTDASQRLQHFWERCQD